MPDQRVFTSASAALNALQIHIHGALTFRLERVSRICGSDKLREIHSPFLALHPSRYRVSLIVDHGIDDAENEQRYQDCVDNHDLHQHPTPKVSSVFGHVTVDAS